MSQYLLPYNTSMFNMITQYAGMFQINCMDHRENILYYIVVDRDKIKVVDRMNMSDIRTWRVHVDLSTLETGV